MTSAHLAMARVRTALSVLRETVADVSRGRSADSVLAGRFRTEKRFGSRDRRFIGDMVFSYFRCQDALARAGLTSVSAEALLGCVTADGSCSDETAAALCEETDTDPDRWRLCAACPSPAERFHAFLRLRHLPDELPEAGAELFFPDTLNDEFPAGFDVRRYAEICMTRSPLWLRIRSGEAVTALQEAGYETQSHPVLSSALLVRNPSGALRNLEAFRQGLFEIQDLSSQCIGLAFPASAGESWLDCCAGAGGKSLQLADRLQNTGSILAGDCQEGKLRELEQRAARAGVRIIRTVCRSAETPRPDEQYDGVLADAPCSSSGRWRRNPDGRFHLTPECITGIASLQKRILHAAASSVRPGGILVYATCSVFRRENEEQIHSFLAEHPEFVREEFPHPLLKHTRSSGGVCGILPWMADCDASFAACLRKAGQQKVSKKEYV